MNVSVTLLSAYDYCSRKLFMSNVLKLIEPPKEAMTLGSIRHKTFEEINDHEESIVKSVRKNTSFEDLFDKIKKIYGNILRRNVRDRKEELKSFGLHLPSVFKNSWPSIMREANERTKNIFEFMNRTKLEGEELWQELTPKISSEVKIISNNLKLIGVIDQVRNYTQYLEPVELKTGSAPSEGVWSSHRLQIGAYIMLLREERNNSYNKGIIRYLDTATTRKVILNPFLETEVLKQRDKVISLLSGSSLPERTKNIKKCSSCPFKDTCYDDKQMEKLMEEFSEKGKL